MQKSQAISKRVLIQNSLWKDLKGFWDMHYLGIMRELDCINLEQIDTALWQITE